MGLLRKKQNDGFGEGFSLGRFLTKPFRYVFSRFGSTDQGLGAEVSPLKKFTRFSLQLVVFPFFLLWQFAVFLFSSWTTTRDGRAAMWGLIPLGGIFIVGAIVVGGNFFESRRIKGSNQLEVVNAMAVEDYDKAILHSRRIQNISKGESEKFMHATTLVNAGMEENGMALMESIAPPDRAGYIPAHYYQAQRLFGRDRESPERAGNLALARKHLEWIEQKAVQSSKNDAITIAARGARGLLPLVMFEQGDTKNAANRAMQISNMQPEVVPKLVEYLFDSGQPEMARRHIARGIEGLNAYAAQNSAVYNQPDYWKLRHEIRMLNSDYDVINRELFEGLDLISNSYTSAIISQLLSKVRYDYANEFKRLTDQDTVRRRVKFLCSALEAWPQNQDAMEALIELYAFPPSEDVRLWCEQMARDELSTFFKHLLLGILDGMRGLPGTAEKQLILALNASTRSAAVAEGFCRIMGQQDNQRDAAMNLTEVIISAWEGPPSLYKVRGELAMAMDQTEEALRDFDYCQRYMQNDISLFEMIEQCQMRLGQTEKASDTRQKIDELKERQAEEIELLKQSLNESPTN